MKKILIIEDEKILANMYRDKFSQAGFKVLKAFEAKEGLALAKKEKPDLIILDILLPKENGIFFLEKWRKTPAISSALVIAFSNYDDPEIKRQAKKLGARDYLIKTDYTPEEVVNKVKEYLRETLFTDESEVKIYANYILKSEIYYVLCRALGKQKAGDLIILK